jgi:hypothetical protein
MNQETALHIVYECLLGDNSIPQELRSKQGLNQPKLDELVNAVKFLIDYYAEQDTIPKKLALCMVDIYGYFSFREGFYDDAEATKIEDAGILLQELATDLFS